MTDIFQFVPQHFKTAEGTFLAAFLQASNEQASILDAMIQAGVQQQFLSTASGRYLLLLGEQSGFAMPPNSGLDITAVRGIVPVMVSAPSQVPNTINQIIEVFYGSNNLKPSVTCTVSEPYNLLNGDDLLVDTDQGLVDIPILASQVSDITNVSAQEIVGILNISQSAFAANVYTDTRSGKNYVQLNSKSFGLSSFLRIAGGTLQNVLQFPKTLSTNIQAGTVWNVSKAATYDDLTVFTWNGSGTNPQVYNVNPGDTVTIRGLVNNAAPISNLNGSYTVVDCGYDYFKVRNQNFPYTSATVTQAYANTIFFTSQDNIKLYDNGEYAVLSETIDDTATVVVPAIPTLTKRYLEGSAHLHGYEYPVVGFTRTTLTIDDSLSDVPPIDNNSFVLANNMMRYSYLNNYRVKTTSSDSLVPKTMNIDQTDTTLGVLPYTVAQLVGTNPLYADVGSDMIIMTFPFKHGLRRSWGFTLSTASQAGNLTSSLLNKEQVVSEVIDDYSIGFKVLAANGAPVAFTGASFTGFNLIQYSSIQPDSSDFYLQFPNALDASNSGLEVGMKIKVLGGTVGNQYIADKIYSGYLEVKSILGSVINVRSGIGAGGFGTVLTSPTGYMPVDFGGNTTYFLDQTTAHNQQHVMDNLTALFLANSGSSNSSYVGSYIYDPLGTNPSSTVTLTNVSTTLDQPLLKGDNETVIFVNDVSNFPSSGYIVMDYGTDAFDGPIFYSSIIENPGNSQIVIDPSYKFKATHVEGAVVSVVSQNVPYKPSIYGADLPVYLTSPAQARNTLQQLINLLLAAGIFLDFEVLFPQLRDQDPAIAPYA